MERMKRNSVSEVKRMIAIIRTFFRLMIMTLFFVGGWVSSEYVHQDPFLASLFPSGFFSSSYERLLGDFRSIIGDLKSPLQTEENRQSDSQEATFNLTPDMPSTTPAVQGDQSGGSEAGVPPVEEKSTDHAGVEVFNLNGMIETLNQGLTMKEKLSFLLWARSKFTEAEMKEISTLVEGGLTQENFIRLYEKIKDKLKPEDYAYLLTFMDRYVALKENETLPAFQPNELAERKAYAQ